ncbi:MAG: undecaprenyl-phosphate glucose phosphotransferase [Rubrivivax sp.]
MFSKPAGRFLPAPPTTTASIAALLEPATAAGSWLILHAVFGQPVEGPSIAVLLLTVLMLFPGVNRLGRTDAGLFLDIALSWTAVVVVLGLLGYATREYHDFHPPMVIAWLLLTPVAQWAATSAATYSMHRLLRRPQAIRRAVVVGGGAAGVRVAGMLRGRADQGWQYLGLFDDRGPDRLEVSDEAARTGPIASLPGYIDGHRVSDVFITLPLGSQPRIQQLLAMLQNTTASLHFVPDVFGAHVIQGRLELIGDLPVLGLHLTPFTGINRWIKRASDLLLGSLILVLIAPVMALVAIGVKRSSPGPVIFKQRRTGMGGETIWVYKFRSMTTLDDGPNVRQATRGDPRVTPFGAFIRRTSLDELPQFVNVLQGRMSIVGPRPHALAHNDHYRGIVRAYMARHKVRPGITGWAQVNGCRGETDTVEKMARRVEYDLEYLHNWSLSLDLLIIARTVHQVFFNRGVY